MASITKDSDVSVEINREKRKRIGSTLAIFMVGTASIFDFLQGILNIAVIGIILSSFVSMVAWLTFFLWFKLNDVSFFDSGARMIIVYFGSFFLELIPIINTLPIWTLSVVLMIMIVRAKDRIYNRRH